MYYTATRRSRFSRGKRLGCGFFFLFSLIFLVSGSIPALLNLPGLQARFSGIETTALATAVGSCGSDDNGNNSYYYRYTFTGITGKVYQITNSSVCSSGIVSDGERVTIWYQLNDPTHFITANDWTFDWIFFAGFSIPMILFGIFIVSALLRLLFVGMRGY